MIERPILFSGPMVRAIMDGTKTQTRRALRSQPPDGWNLWRSECEPSDGLFTWDFCGVGEPWGDCECNAVTRCPYGQPGDRLWVRETWRETGSAMRTDGRIPEWGTKEQVRYAADDQKDGPWRPSIFMPRWASRLTLDVVAVRVERVQDISEADAIAEGLTRYGDNGWSVHGASWWSTTPRKAYSLLWDGINDARGYGWAVNPWVWVVEFRRVQP